MKKILICFTGAMEIGGIERSLITLLNFIDYSEYEVDLFLYGHRGSLYGEICGHVKILPEIKELSLLRNSLKDKIQNKAFYSAYLESTPQPTEIHCT